MWNLSRQDDDDASFDLDTSGSLGFDVLSIAIDVSSASGFNMGVVDTSPSVDSVDVATRVEEVSICLRDFEEEETDDLDLGLV
jgi:hypothetical protein